MKKIFIFLSLLFLFSFSFVFAQSERRGTFIGTFGMGGGFKTTIETVGQLSSIFDLNFISKAGFTLCTTNIISLSIPMTGVGASQNILFGAGYHYMIDDKWIVGGALLASPIITDLLLAGKINGSYFFTDNIGVTGIVTYRSSVGITWDLAMFDVFAGVSIKLF